jgi:hypothetical protein
MGVPCLWPDVGFPQSLPYTVASLLATFPNALLSEIIDLLCSNLLPVILGERRGGRKGVAVGKPNQRGRHALPLTDGGAGGLRLSSIPWAICPSCF